MTTATHDLPSRPAITRSLNDASLYMCTYFFFLVPSATALGVMNCSSVVAGLEDASEHVNAHVSTNNLILGAALVCVALPLLAYGHRTFVPVIAILCGTAASWLMLRATSSSDDCILRLTMTIVAAIVAILPPAPSPTGWAHHQAMVTRGDPRGQAPPSQTHRGTCGGRRARLWR